MATDSALEAVARTLAEYCKRKRRPSAEFFGGIVRQALDEVIDGPRTGRWALEQLSKTEQTYVGTKIEILIKAALELDSGVEQDAIIAGHEVDIKWSKTLQWMIGPENIGKLILGLGTNVGQTRFSVGVFRASPELLRVGANRDGKVSLSAQSLRAGIPWVVESAPLAQNFIASLPIKIRTAIFAEPSAQSRVRALITLVQDTPIPREAFLTVARNKFDPMRRLRQDTAKSDPLGGMRVLSAKMHGPTLIRLGFKNVPKDHWISIPSVRVDKLRDG
jgi:hypothetical protein